MMCLPTVVLIMVVLAVAGCFKEPGNDHNDHNDLK
jgi:hypothetical protein